MKLHSLGRGVNINFIFCLRLVHLLSDVSYYELLKLKKCYYNIVHCCDVLLSNYQHF